MKIIIIQSIPDALELVKSEINRAFPNLKDKVLYENDFERSLTLIPKDEEITVISSQVFHDREDILFTWQQKNGDRLAEEIKKINPKAKFFLFSSVGPVSDHVDDWFPKSPGSYNVAKEIIQIFIDLKLNK